MKALWGAVSVEISVEMLWTSAVFVQGAGVAAAVAWSGIGARGAGKLVGLVGDKRSAMT